MARDRIEGKGAERHESLPLTGGGSSHFSSNLIHLEQVVVPVVVVVVLCS